MCFCPISDKKPSFSQQNSSLFVLSALYPLFLSNLFFSHPSVQSGSPWIDINGPLKKEADTQRHGYRDKKVETTGWKLTEIGKEKKSHKTKHIRQRQGESVKDG